MSSVHASCVSIGGVGILIRGEPGSGKSSLCLRLVDGEGRGVGETALQASLVSDDQVELTRDGDNLIATPPPALAGLLEVRGLGLVHLRHEKQVEIRLIVDLLSPMAIPRLPETAKLVAELSGITFPRLMLDGKSPAAPAILRASLTYFRLLVSP